MGGSNPPSNIRVFTKADTVQKFVELGFHLVCRTSSVGLLEWVSEFPDHIEKLKSFAVSLPHVNHSGCIVMNANPCTRGHEYLMKTATELCDRLFVLVVEEDCSQFSFSDRFAMVKEVAEGLPPDISQKIIVIPSGFYCISQATFPSYFTKDTERVAVHAELDLKLFCTQATALGVSTRYAGDEPYSRSTEEYNATMARILPKFGIDFILFKRLCADDSMPISATKVRGLIASGNIDAACTLLPQPSANTVRRIYG